MTKTMSSTPRMAKCAWLAAALALVLCALPSAARAASWTVMVYLDADNDLEGAGLHDMNEMEAAPSDPDVNVVVQVDRAPGYDDSNGDWTDTRRYLISHDTDTQNISSQQVGPSLGELDMGAPKTLTDFVTWAAANYPADHYLLVVWDHGSGWKKDGSPKPHKGTAYDETSSFDCLTVGEFASALTDAKAALGRNIDIVACDACLMGMVEVAYPLRDCADYFVASEETVPWDGYPYQDILSELASSPTMSPADLCSLMVTAYTDSYNGGSQGYSYCTLSAVDLSEMGAVASACDDLATALTNAMDSHCPEILTYVSGAQPFFDPDYLDLYHLAQLLHDNVPDSGVTSAAAAVESALSAAVVDSAHVGSEVQDAHGLSIYYPFLDSYELSYDLLSFAADTGWDEYVSSDPPCHEILPDAYEVDDSAGQSSVIAVGSTQTDHWFHSHGDPDWARFQAEAGKNYFFETRNLGRECDTVLALYDRDGITRIALDDDSGSESLASRIVWRCPRDGTYYLRVTDYSPDMIGLQTRYDLYATSYRFSDVPPDYWAFQYVEACADASIVGGYGDGTYRPSQAVTRDQMAVYISRALMGGDANVPAGPATATFPDVPTDYWAFKYVECAAANHIVGGYGDGTYRPSQAVTRDQMAVFVARAIVDPTGDDGLASYTPPSTPTFSDVPDTHWAYKYVEYIAAQGVSNGYDDGTYRPDVVVTRDQMAVYVGRAFGLL